jgi:hypothetical protein
MKDDYPYEILNYQELPCQYRYGSIIKLEVKFFIPEIDKYDFRWCKEELPRSLFESLNIDLKEVMADNLIGLS